MGGARRLGRTVTPPKSAGEAAYAEYVDGVHTRVPRAATMLTPWDALPLVSRARWERVASAALAFVSGRTGVVEREEPADV
jgi:hypothetical protein